MTNYPNLDDKIRINFFSSPKKRNSKLNSQIICANIGSFVYGGFNDLNHKNRHRIKSTKCGKRFGNDVEVWNLLLYQQKLWA